MNGSKKPLFRKENTRSHGVNHYRGIGPDSKNDRNTKTGLRKSMSSRKLGLDFRPLFLFLQASVGKKWVDVYSEAKSRIPADKSEVINWIFGNGDTDEREIIRIGDNVYFSRLVVDDEGILQKYSSFSINQLYPSCGCCTHTLNGKVVMNKWNTPNKIEEQV